ncbi:hypothetical protein ACKWTF_002774 [Chironomus riparius]
MDMSLKFAKSCKLKRERFKMSRFSEFLSTFHHHREINMILNDEHAPRSWIEANFFKRECIKFIPSQKDEDKCCCGQERTTHQIVVGIDIGILGDVWLPHKHTRAHPTDAYGTIEFQGSAHPTKAQYVRLSYDTRPELIVQLFTKEWNLELPKLLLTIQGGKANFELQPKLKKILRKGLIKAARTTGAWIFTGGTNTGVTKQVGDALMAEGQQRSGRVVSIGIAPWGIVERNHELLGHNRDVPCHSISSPRSKLAVLNNRHAYFLLVDNGTQAKYGAEIILRRKLEKYISNQKLQPFGQSSTPVVCLVIEGGMNTIRAVLEYVTDKVPVVVVDGTGRSADIIAFVHKYANENDQGLLDSMKDYILNMIMKTFEVGVEQAECLYNELLQCTKYKNLITVFRIQDRPEGKVQELDQTIITALFKSQHLSPSEQLSLALTWNRVDIARSEIFVYGQEWAHGALDEAMMQALEHDRIDFVKLLLENGVSMRKFLTIPRLEELYNTKHGPGNTLGYILRDVRPHIPKGYIYTLHDIGLVINKLMGGAYRSYYTRRKFRPIYAKVMNSYVNTHRKASTFQRTAGANSMSLVTGLLPFTSEMALFPFPFNELFIWAVLTKRHQMATMLWQHGEEALAKSLVACKLYKSMAHEAADDDLDTEIYDELRNYAKDFESRGLKLLDFCYRQEPVKTQKMLTCELTSWSNQSCLSLAVAANHRSILAHPCSQIILSDLWMGGLRTRKNTNLNVIAGLFLPIYIKKLDFKTREELQSMPQTEEEHLENQYLDYEDKEKSITDAEALLSDTYSLKDTKVQENGKVSLTDSDNTQFNPYDDDTRVHRPLKLKKKFYEFYTAPITKFWADSIAYIIFLFLFTYTILVRMEATPCWQEIYSIAYITTLGFEKVREILSSEPVAICHKFAVWSWNMWNPCDGVAIVTFIIGVGLRFRPNMMDIGRVIYCVNSIYWYLRILNILGVNKYLGPLVTMMGKMVKNMIYFVVLLLVVLMSFGVSRQSILNPNKDADWRLVRDVFFQPYFMLYGEVFADDIDPPCGEDPSQEPCITGHWITPIAMSMYLLIANILLINLLIAVFNNIFNETNSISHQVWMFQRFTVVMEYQQKPVLPPPLICICHFYCLLKYCFRKAKGLQEVRDNGLKLFLEKDDMERLYDFEEECVEGFFQEQNMILLQSTEERIKNTDERVENMYQKIEDINTKENLQVLSIQNMEFRLRKMEESTEQILNHLAVIHRFMSTHINDDNDIAQGSIANLSFPHPLDVHRNRTVSENDSGNMLTSIMPTTAAAAFDRRPRKFNRSLTEVRPDAYIFDEGAHFEVRTVLEENEVMNSTDEINDLASSIRNRKLSVQSEEPEYCASTPTAHQNPQISIESEPLPAIPPPLSLLIPRSDSINRRSICMRQETTASTESKDTLTPLDGGGCEEKAIAGGDGTLDEIEKQRFGLRRRNSQLGRRNSESQHYDINRSQTSLNYLGNNPLSKRQFSLTQSEPDTEINGATAVSKGAMKAGRHMLLHIHAEYTSITDELESMIASPTTSLLDEKPKNLNELTNPEFVALMEKQHLKECEDDDYAIMEGLLQTKTSFDGSDDNLEGGFDSDYSHRRMLRRETAIELPITPAKMQKIDETYTQQNTEFQLKNEKNFVRASSMSENRADENSPPNQRKMSYLNPDSLEQRYCKISDESLYKNSSTETEYSAQPYHVIKQNSNDTNSSFNIDNSSFTNDLSIDAETSLNATVIENSNNINDAEQRMPPKRASTLCTSDGRPSFLRKQFSMDQGNKRPLSENLECRSTTVVQHQQHNLPKMPSPRMHMHVLKESSSTSTEDTRDDSRKVIPTISTHLIQDEIAKLSLNIKSSTEEDDGSDENLETMC